MAASPKYAWVVAVACFLGGICVITGMFMYGYNVAFIAEEFGVQVADLAIATSLYGALGTGLATVWGLIGNKLGARLTMTIGMVGLGVFLVLCGTPINQSPVTFIILYSIGGALAATLGGAITPKLIASWFAPNHRAKGMMINTLGGSGSGAVLGIVVPIIIMGQGWRGCFMTMGFVCIVCGILFFLLCRNSPESMGTHAFGYTAEEAERMSALAEASEAQISEQGNRKLLMEVVKSPITWLFGIAYIIWQFYFMGAQAFQTPAILAAGFDLVTVGLIGMFNMVCLMVSQVLFSTLSDRFLSRKAFLAGLCIICGVLQLGVPFFLSQPGVVENPTILIVYMCVIGLTTGQAAMLNTLMAEVYPVHLRGTGPGVIYTISLIGTFFGPLIAAAIVNAAGGDMFVNFYFIGICLIVSGIIYFVILPKTGGKHGDPLAEKAGLNISLVTEAEAE